MGRFDSGMNVDSSLAIIIPALNESASIAEVVKAARAYGLPIVVDDGSTDATGQIAGSAGADVVSHPHNMGYDAALDSGFRRAAQLNCELAVTMDADGQHDPSILTSFLGEFERGADIVIGVRDRHQRLAERVFALAARRLWRIQDPLCGMKGYRMEIYRRRGHFDSFGSIGTELAIFAVRSKFRIAQVPVKTLDRTGSPRFGRLLQANWKIFRALILSLWRTTPNRSRE